MSKRLVPICLIARALFVALVVFFALPTIAQAQNQPSMSAQQCAAAYVTITNTLNSCLADAPKAGDEQVEKWRQICNCIWFGDCPQDISDSIGYGEAIYCAGHFKNDDWEQGIKVIKENAFSEFFDNCLDVARNSFASVKPACQSVSPNLFSSSCISDRTISNACHSKCTPDTCKACEPGDAAIKIACNPSVNAQAPAAIATPCSEALKNGLACVRTLCANNSGSDRDKCIAQCEADRKVQWDACWLASGMEPPALSALKDEPGVLSTKKITKTNLQAKKTATETGTAGVNRKSPTNNLDRFDLGPNYVTTSPSLPNQRAAAKPLQGRSSTQRITTPESSFDARPARSFENQRMRVIEPQQQIK